MPTNNLNLNTETNFPGGSPYFEFKSTLQLFIANKKWTSLKQSAYNMLAIFPEEAFGWFALGIAFSRLGDFASAITNLKKALYHDPNMVSADYQLGITYYRNNDYIRAIEHYEAALAKGMNTEFIQYNLGNAWLKLNNPDTALQYYIKSLSISSNFTPAVYGLFRIYFSKNDYQKAVSSLKPIINNDKLPSYLLAQAKLLYDSDSETNFFKLRQASNLLTSAISLDDNFALAYYERAFVKSKLGDNKGCLNDKTKAFQLEPELRKGHTFSLFSNYYM